MWAPGLLLALIEDSVLSPGENASVNGCLYVQLAGKQSRAYLASRPKSDGIGSGSPVSRG